MPVTTPTTETSRLEARRDQLLHLLRGYGNVAVALSGGIDSTVVARAAVEALGSQAVAVTADSPSVPRRDLDDACAIARQIGIRHVVLRTQEFANHDYLKNDGTRCYYCKSELYSRIDQILPELGVSVICSGANLDDQGDYRPGLIAAAEHRVRHPLQEAGFTKADVRALAKVWGLSNWDKPASPCLSSRIAPGTAVTAERTARIEQAELYLKSLGLRDCRVRLHEGELARIEVPASDLSRLAGEPVRSGLVARMQELGFRFITLDLMELRSGSLNDLVSLEIRTRYQDQVTTVPQATRSDVGPPASLSSRNPGE